MVEISRERSVHVFIFEPRVDGHHIGYLKVITEELVGAGYRLTLAVNTNPEPYAQIRMAMADILGRVSIISATDGSNGGATIRSVSGRNYRNSSENIRHCHANLCIRLRVR